MNRNSETAEELALSGGDDSSRDLTYKKWRIGLKDDLMLQSAWSAILVRFVESVPQFVRNVLPVYGEHFSGA